MEAWYSSAIAWLRAGVLLCLLLLLLSPAWAVDHFIRDGATGSAPCTAGWGATQACDQLPATLTRGDTYYIADGTYPGYSFDDATSGALVITIKKATVADHGSSTGWSDAFGDGTATFDFNGLAFDTNNWVFDGQTRSSISSGYGFVIDALGTTQAIVINMNSAPSNVTIRYTQVIGGNLGTVEDRCINMVNGGGNITIENSDFQFCHTPFKLANVNGFTLKNSRIYKNVKVDGGASHTEGIACTNCDNFTVAYNEWRDIHNTGTIVCLDAGTSAANINWNIYGNIFWFSSGNPADARNTDGIIAVINNQSADNWKIFNNTIINVDNASGTQAKIAMEAGDTNIKVYNNYWYKSRNVNHSFSGTSENNYNIYVASTGAAPPTETNGVVESTDTNRFTDWTNGNFTLALATTAGLNTNSLLAANGTDMSGTTRGVDGVWDRGAFEFESNITRPDPPQNLNGTVR